MYVEQLLDTLVTHLNLSPSALEKDSSGYYKVSLNANTAVTLNSQDDHIFLSTKIGPLPKLQNKELLFIYLMQANLIGQGTGGAAIGIDPSEKFFTMSSSLKGDVNFKVFKEGLEDLINYTDYWREEINRFANESSEIEL